MPNNIEIRETALNIAASMLGHKIDSVPDFQLRLLTLAAKLEDYLRNGFEHAKNEEADTPEEARNAGDLNLLGDSLCGGFRGSSTL